MNILLTGESGQLGHDLALTLKGLGTIISAPKEQLNLEDLNQIRSVMRAVKPSLVISPAAYTAVARAETDVDRATRINAEASAVLAQEAATLGAPLVSFSTDYVFDGTKETPYTEDDPVNPLNVYGKTKLAGEEAIRQSGVAHWILRTSWVYSVHGQNFLKTVIRLAQQKTSLSMIADQHGAPTWSMTIARTVRHMLTNGQQHIDLEHLRNTAGTYHLTSQGAGSWHQYACLVVSTLQQLGIPVLLKETDIQATSTDPSAAPIRPLNSRLSCHKLLATFPGLTLPAWEQDVTSCIADIVREYQLDQGQMLTG